MTQSKPHRGRGGRPRHVEAPQVPWDQQVGEASGAYRAFLTYRDLGAERSVTEVARKCHSARGLIGRWCSRWQWVDRVTAWEKAERLKDEAVRREARNKAIAEMEERHVGLSKGLQSKIVEKLQSMKPGELKTSDLHRWLEVAAKVERLALGKPTEHVEGGGTGGSGDGGVFDAGEARAILEDPKLADLAHQIIAGLALRKTTDGSA